MTMLSLVDCNAKILSIMHKYICFTEFTRLLHASVNDGTQPNIFYFTRKVNEMTTTTTAKKQTLKCAASVNDRNKGKKWSQISYKEYAKNNYSTTYKQLSNRDALYNINLCGGSFYFWHFSNMHRMVLNLNTIAVSQTGIVTGTW